MPPAKFSLAKRTCLLTQLETHRRSRMKALLLAVMALFAMNFTAHASNSAPAQDELVPADQLATMDGLNPSDADDSGLYPPPPPHPYPPHPVPPPPPHPYPPHPIPPPPPHPYPPHPVPPPYPYPPYWEYECSSEDTYGHIFTDQGGDPVITQRDVHNLCEEESGTNCTDLGCHRI